MATGKNNKTTKKKTTGQATAKTAKKVLAPSKRAAAKTPAMKKAKTPAASAKSRKAAAPQEKAAVNISAKKKTDMTPRELKILEIRMNLVRQKDLLLNGAEAALNELPGQTIFPDLGDQATAETDRNFMLRLRGREQRLLKKIDEAINRIDAGLFGICDDCGNEIELKRLEARPVTTMCIECKTLQEEEEKLREQ